MAQQTLRNAPHAAGVPERFCLVAHCKSRILVQFQNLFKRLLRRSVSHHGCIESVLHETYLFEAERCS
jgi:hypothetical protein